MHICPHGKQAWVQILPVARLECSSILGHDKHVEQRPQRARILASMALANIGASLPRLERRQVILLFIRIHGSLDIARLEAYTFLGALSQAIHSLGEPVLQLVHELFGFGIGERKVVMEHGEETNHSIDLLQIELGTFEHFQVEGVTDCIVQIAHVHLVRIFNPLHLIVVVIVMLWWVQFLVGYVTEKLLFDCLAVISERLTTIGQRPRE